MNQIRDNILGGNIEAAKILSQSNKTPVARLIEKGISRIGKPLDDINTAIENAGKLEIYKLGTECQRFWPQLQERLQ